MRILNNEGTFEILSKTEDVIGSIASAARTCYQTQDKSKPETDLALVKGILNKGHLAMVEFADMTVRFDLISRGFTHEMVRHRLCNFAQESTRYVDESNLLAVVPPHLPEWFIAKEGVATQYVVLEFPPSEDGVANIQEVSLSEWFELNEQMYRGLRENEVSKEDARQVLPIATKSQIVVKANLREWRHIFKMRCDKYAHWEIRGVMLNLLDKVKKDIPLIFDDFHFFGSAGKEYARPIMSENNLYEEIKHYMISGRDIEKIHKLLTNGAQ